MYTNFFGFSEKPFNVTPDPRFLYESPSHRETLASLIYGIRERRGFIAMVGEVGTGKTTLLKALLDLMDESTQMAFIFNTDMTFVQMLNMALVDLGLASPKETLAKDEALHRLNEFAIEQSTKGGNVAIIVDEAQNLDRRSMENMRLLSNLETRKHKLIQIVLSGQPELDDKLNQPELRQLAQRISLKRYLTPLSEKETTEYIHHRLSIADYRDRYLFRLRAQQLIWQYSGGIPRKINILCDNALLIGYALKQKRIKGHIVEEAIKDLSWSPLSGKAETPAAIPMKDEAHQLETKDAHSQFVSSATQDGISMEEKAHLLKAIASHSRVGSAVTWIAIGMEEKARQLKARLPQTLFTSTKSLVVAACVIFVVGFFLGGLWLKRDNRESPNPHDVVRSKIARRSTVPSEPSDVNMAQDKVSSMSRTDNKAPSLSKADKASTQPQAGNSAEGEIVSGVALASVPEKKTDFIHVIVPQEQKENASNHRMENKRSWKFVIVKQGDLFSKLVASVYGRANENNQKWVHGYNPHIGDIDNIEVGQKIIFPPPYSTE